MPLPYIRVNRWNESMPIHNERSHSRDNCSFPSSVRKCQPNDYIVAISASLGQTRTNWILKSKPSKIKVLRYDTLSRMPLLALLYHIILYIHTYYKYHISHHRTNGSWARLESAFLTNVRVWYIHMYIFNCGCIQVDRMTYCRIVRVNGPKRMYQSFLVRPSDLSSQRLTISLRSIDERLQTTPDLD